MRPVPPRPAPGAGIRRDPSRPAPPRPRPAAPIKRVPARPDEGKPKSKRKGRRPQRAAVPDLAEQSLPEPMPRLDDRKPAAPKIFRKIALTEGVTVKELAEKLEVKHKDVIKVLLARGVLATINQTLDADTAKELAAQFGAEAEILSFEEDVLREEVSEEKPEDLVARAPVVTVMGHVDHGKTSLLDAIRETKVVEQEAGGITQHVGAYSVKVNQRSVVFLDTPGHEAFTMMRARGAGVTDLVVLVVAADDGVMPQTREAVDHARAAKVPVLVAVNKIDKPNANPDRVKQQLNELELVPEDWGGSTVFVEVSAKKREGLDLLLEMILLVADLGELKANPERAGMGTVLEAKLDKGKGPVAHVLIQNGSVEIGDPFVAGAVHGKVRAMLDDRGNKVKKVGPSSPVEILGLTSLPQAGDQFQVFADSFKARQISEFRQLKLREREMASSARLTLDHLHQQVQEGGVKELPIILKADVQGSAEVLTDTLQKLSTEKVKIKIIHAGVGAITDNDVTLALASNAVIIGFNIRPERSAEEIAAKENIDIRLHTVIYNITDELKKAMEGLLEPTFVEVTLGRAEIRDTFKVPKIGVVAGCYVSDGKMLRNADIRLLRDNVVVFEGKIGSLRRFKDDASEVKEGFECGIGIAGYNDVKVGDVIEAYAMEKVQTTTA
jgi:translation initiation factor IF-2